MPQPHTPEAEQSAIALNIQLYNDPEYQALLKKTKDWAQGPQPPRAGTLNRDGTISNAVAPTYRPPKKMDDLQARDYAQTVDRVLAKYGYDRDHMPEGFSIGGEGFLTPKATWWEEWKGPILTVGAMLGGAYLLPLLAGGAPAAAAPGLMPVAQGLPAGLAPTAGTTLASGFGAAAPGLIAPTIATGATTAATTAGTTAATAASQAAPYASNAVFYGSAIPPAAPLATGAGLPALAAAPLAAAPLAATLATPPNEEPYGRISNPDDYTGAPPAAPAAGPPPIVPPPVVKPPPEKQTSTFNDLLKGQLINTAINAGIGGLNYYLANRANDQALAALQKGTDEALALEKEKFDTIHNDLSVYRDVGGSAMKTLGGLMGLQMPGGGAAPNAPLSVRPEGSKVSDRGVVTTPEGTTYRVKPPEAPVVGQARGRTTPRAEPRGGPKATTSNRPLSPEETRTQSSVNATRTRVTPDRMVMLEGPDGSRQAFPMSQAKFYVDQGARVVS